MANHADIQHYINVIPTETVDMNDPSDSLTGIHSSVDKTISGSGNLLVSPISACKYGTYTLSAVGQSLNTIMGETASFCEFLSVKLVSGLTSVVQIAINNDSYTVQLQGLGNIVALPLVGSADTDPDNIKLRYTNEECDVEILAVLDPD